MSVPTATISNRDSYRRSLQSSLNDILGELPHESLPRGDQGLSVPNSQQGARFSGLGAPVAGGHPGLSQSLGFGGQVPTGLGVHDSVLLARAAESQLLQQAAKSAFLHQTFASQQNNKMLQNAYANLVRKQGMGSMTGLPGISFPGQMSGQPFFAPSAAMQRPPRDFAAEKRIKTAQTLKALGTSLRSRYDPFIDCIDLEDPEPECTRRARGGVSEHFPERLHRMLIDLEQEGNTDIVSFYSHGRAFGVHDMDRFVNEIMPKYFKQSKWNSFARQLNLYGFVRMASGPDAGGYYHELFLKGRPSLCRYMRRVGVPQGQQDRRKCRPKNVVDIQEPDFYALKPSR